MLKQEETDFRLMVHAKHAIDSNNPVIIWSNSADTYTQLCHRNGLVLFYQFDP